MPRIVTNCRSVHRRQGAPRLPPTARRVLAATAVVVLLGAGLAQALPVGGGALPDPTFGNGHGYVTTSIRGVSVQAYAATVLPNGDIVIAGQTTRPNGNGQIMVARYKPDGSLDPSFGSGGLYRSSFREADGPYIATSVVPVNSSGSLLVGGGYGLGSMLALRLTSAGRPDTAFGAKHNGLAVVPVGGIASSIALERNHQILLGGSNANANGRPMVVAELTSSGRVDRRFGRAGIAQVLFWNADLAASAGVLGLIPTSDGGVLGFGHLDYIGSDGHGSAGVFRLSSTGHLAPSFGTKGHVEVAFTNTNGKFAQWFPCAIAAAPSGRITVTGDGSMTGQGGQLLSAALTAQGTPDSSFGTKGRAVTPGLSGDNNTTCGAYTSSESLTAGVGGAVIRLFANGTPDTGFAPAGVLRISTPKDVTLNAAASVPNPTGSTFVAAGSAGNDAYVGRFVVRPPFGLG